MRKLTKKKPGLSFFAALAAKQSGRPACSLERDFAFTINQSGVRVRYKLDSEGEKEWRSGIYDGGSHTVEILLKVTTRVVNFEAFWDGQTRVWDAETDDLKDENDTIPIVASSLNSQGITLRWDHNRAGVEHFEIFLAPYDERTPPGTLKDLVGSGDGRPFASPMKVEVGASELTVDETGERWTFHISGLGTNSLNRLKWYAFAVRASDGCESRIIAAHTQSAPFTSTWRRKESYPRASVLPPGIPPILMDRGGDSRPPDRGPDGAPDLVVWQSDGGIYTLLNDGSGGLIKLDPAPNNKSAQFGGRSEEPPVRAFATELDSDTRSDLIAATTKRIRIFIADDRSGFRLAFKDFGDDIRIPKAPKQPDGLALEFYDVNAGDFNSDGVTDIAASVGDDGKGVLYLWVWFGAVDDEGLPVVFENPLFVGGLVGVAKEDGGFLVGDLDADGRDDILYKLSGKNPNPRHQFVSYLFRANSSIEPRIVGEFTEKRALRWNHSKLIDCDHDGFLDLVTTGFDGITEPPVAKVVVYLNDGRGAINGSNERFPKFLVSDFNGSSFCFEDMDGDGLTDIVQRSTNNGSIPWSGVLIWRGRRDLATGLQNWGRFEGSASVTKLFVDLESVGEKTLAAFATADLNSDGVRDLVAYHTIESSSANSWKARVILSHRAWNWGTSVAHVVKGGTTVARFSGAVVGCPRKDDVFLGIVSDPTNTVHKVAFLPLKRDQFGRPAGGFAEFRLSGFVAGMPASSVIDSVFSSVSTGPGEVIALLANGDLGTIYWETSTQPSWRPATPSRIEDPGGAKLFAARTNTDGDGDLVVWRSQRATGEFDHELLVFETDERQGRRLVQRERVPLKGKAEFVDVLDVGKHTAEWDGTGQRDGLSDVAVVMAKSAGTSGMRELRIFVTAREALTGRTSLVEIIPGKPATVASEIVSLTAANFTATAGVSEGVSLSLVAGAKFGTLFQFALPRTGPLPANRHPQIDPLGIGAIQVRAVDMNYDQVLDLVVLDEKTEKATVFTNSLVNDPDLSWRRTGLGVFREAGNFSTAGLIPFFDVLNTNDDVYPDIIFLRADKTSGATWLSVGHQELPK